ncbi:hypothetical protein GH5_01669 [Leishmania sp. Ghana 2012 LV757]|uniref:hypothetical protein n=1 Tax=Leishmania sp. Ghana 2012 LV757 TaxID=2803181 RepID=UPI001B4DC505|nr:hypothetical protein GH5_01669 [Leishmania sp. Ghana 2012 LV757]
MAPRRSRVKRLRLPGATRRLEVQPTANPHVCVAPPVAPPPSATAPAAKPPTSLEPPVAASVRPVATSADPEATVAQGRLVEETPAASTQNSTPASTVCLTEHAAEGPEARAAVAPAHVAADAAAAPAGEAMPPAAPSVPSARTVISAHRRRLRAKRRVATALARKAKHHRNTICAAHQDISPPTSSQSAVPAPAPETAPVAAVETPAAEPISVVAETTSAQVGVTASHLTSPSAATAEVPSLVAPAPIATAHRATISRIPKKRKFFAELNAGAADRTAAAPPQIATSEKSPVSSHPAAAPSVPVEPAVEALPVDSAPSSAPPVTPTTAGEEATKKTSAASDALPAPATARRMATHRISKKHPKGAAAKLRSSGSNLVSAEAIPEAAAAVTAAATVKAPPFDAAPHCTPETSAVPTVPVAAALSEELPQRVASLTPESAAPEMTAAAAAAPSDRAVMSSTSKKRKRFFVELDEPPVSGATPSIQEAFTTPAVAGAAVALGDAAAAAARATEEPTALTVEVTPIPPAAAVGAAGVVATKATSTRAMTRRRSMKRKRLPPQAAAPTAATVLPSETITPTSATPTAEVTSASVTEADQATEVAAPAESSCKAAKTVEAASPVESATSPAAQRKLHSSKAQSSKKKARRLTAAAIRRRELAAYNRIPKRFRPPLAPRSVFSRAEAEPEDTLAPTDAPAFTAAVEAAEATEVLQPAAVSATQIESMEDTPEMPTEARKPASVEAGKEAPAVEEMQTPPGTSSASAAAAVQPAVVVTDTAESAVPFTVATEEPRRMSQARMATKSTKRRMTMSSNKRFFTAPEEEPAANLTEAAATETTLASMEAQPAAPQPHAVTEEVESSPQVTGTDRMVDAEPTVVEEAVTRQSGLSAESEAASATAALEEASTEESQLMADHQPMATEETASEVVEELREGNASFASASTEVQAQAPALTQKKVVRFTNVRDMLKAIRKAKRAGKQGHAKKRIHGTPSSQRLTTAIENASDGVPSANASSVAAEERVPAEADDAEVVSVLQEKAEAVAVASVEGTEALSATEQPTAVCAQTAEVSSAAMETDMTVEATTVTPEVTEAFSAAAVDEEVVQPLEALPRAEVHVSPPQAEDSATVKNLLPHAFSSPSPARRQAAKQKIKKHAKLAAARLSKRQTYTVSAASSLAAPSAPTDTMDSPLKAVDAAAEPTMLPAEEAPAAALASRAALVLPSGNVVMESFTDDEMVLRRTALDDGWDVGLRFDWQERTLAISSFPTFEEADRRAAHPFVQRFKLKPRWLLKEVNETSAAHMKRALDSMNRSLTARFVFRHLR